MMYIRLVAVRARYAVSAASIRFCASVGGSDVGETLRASGGSGATCSGGGCGSGSAAATTGFSVAELLLFGPGAATQEAMPAASTRKWIGRNVRFMRASLVVATTQRGGKKISKERT